MGWSEQHCRIVRAIAGLVITTAGLWCGNQATADLAGPAQVASGLDQPLFVTQAPDDANRLFIETPHLNGSQLADADTANENSAVPEPSSVFLGAFFAGLFILVTYLRWRFDRSAIRN